MESENFEILISEPSNSDTIVITTNDIRQEMVDLAVRNYVAKNTAYSTYLNELGATNPEVTPQILDNLAINAQNELDKIIKINAIVRKYINKNDIIGKVEEIIDSNTNTNYKISYNRLTDDIEYDDKILDKVKAIINDFNDEINLQSLIRRAVGTSHREGNFICYCRKVKDNYLVSWLPLGVAEVSDYDINGEPVILINMKELQAKLRKTYKKTKKNKALFFDKIEEEIKANYPPEVYKAYKDGDPYAKLDYRWTGVVRINNQNRKYGLTPIFRALYPCLMLEQFDNTDMVNSKVRAKKIIVQLMRKELIAADNSNKEWYFEEQAYNHETLMDAFSQKTVLVTCNPTVEDVKYVSCSDTGTTDKDTINIYRERILSSLGVGFLMSSSSTGASTAVIALNELLKTINSITSQIEVFIKKWYKNILTEEKIDNIYVPNINILDSEMLDFESRKALATTLYTIFNGSLTSSLEILGVDIADEKAKREHENDIGMEQIFTPRATSYTSSGKETQFDEKVTGRPKEDNIETKAKQDYDEQYNQNGRV